MLLPVERDKGAFKTLYIASISLMTISNVGKHHGVGEPFSNKDAQEYVWHINNHRNRGSVIDCLKRLTMLDQIVFPNKKLYCKI